MFAAMLDTCVLWPSLQRDFLLSLAIEGLYRPLWSEAVLAELHRNEQVKLTERGRDRESARTAADHLVMQMRTAFDDALVTGWEGLDGTYHLPDPGDEHVVAAAVVGQAGVIVTENVRDFPPDRLPSHVQVSSGRDFAADTADVDPGRAVRALRVMAGRRTGESARRVVDLLVSRYAMHEVAEIVGPHLDTSP